MIMMIAELALDAKKKLVGLDEEGITVPMKNVSERLLAATANAGKEKDFAIPMMIVFQVLNVRMTENGVYSLEEVIVEKILGLGNAINSLNGYKKHIG